MQKELFEDLMKLNNEQSEPGGTIEEIIRKHASPAQLKVLNTETEGADTRDSVTKIVQLTGYGHEAGATQDAQQFKHPNVFAYRTAVFPNPVAYGITVDIIKAEPFELREAKNPMYKWAIDLTVSVTGPKAKRDSWLAAFENKIRLTNK